MKSRTLALIAVLVFAAPILAERELPPALQDAEPRQLMGVGFGLMQLTEPEKEQFGEIIRTFSEDVRHTVAREVRKNAPNQQRRIQRRVKDLFEDLDERVASIVTEERRQGYLIFKKGLADQMSPR